MKRNLMFITTLLLLSLIIAGCGEKGAKSRKRNSDTLVIYALEGFKTWGMSDAVFPRFESLHRCKVQMETMENVTLLLEKLEAERDNPHADVAIGIDNTFLREITRSGLLEPYKPQNLRHIPKGFHFDDKNLLTPFAYSYLGFLYDSRKVAEPPTTFGSMSSQEWTGSFILVDPEVSGLGRAMILLGIEPLGVDGFLPFWQVFQDNVHSYAISPEEAYIRFLGGEGSFVLSYTTRLAYHLESDDPDRYKVFIPQESGYRIVDAAGVVRDCDNQDLARKFIEYMLTADYQKHVPKILWKFPVNDDVDVPSSLKATPRPDNDNTYMINRKLLTGESTNWFSLWKSTRAR